MQDLAVGYGSSASRYAEPKRVVVHKSMGPLISAEEMMRCIHCTRCVRFGQEVAGVMELGMAGRGEHAEILSFVGESVDSELSGNMIDVCPVGALTSKPFRYEARTWELSRRKSISPHDSLGSNLIVQVKNNVVMRVLPLENEEVNECWLSDRDRFSYKGLNAPDRLLRPMLKQGGQWSDVDWSVALDYAAQALTRVKSEHGAEAIGALAWAGSTLEELHLLTKVVRGLGSDNIDFRLRHLDMAVERVPWLGMKIADIGKLNSVLLVGSSIRKDHPLLTARLRAAARRGCKVSVLHAVDADLLDTIFGVAQTSRVDQHERNPPDRQRHFDGVASRPRTLSHNCSLGLSYRVDKARLSRVSWPSEDDPDPVPQRLYPRLREPFGELVGERLGVTP